MKKWLALWMCICVLLCAPVATWAEPEASPAPSGTLDGILHWPQPEAGITGGLFTEPETIETSGRGITVICVQQRLRELGYFPYKPTGYFGTTTFNSLMAFQTRNNLAATGAINPETKEALFATTAVRSAIKQPTAYTAPPSVRPRDYGELLSWADVNEQIPEGTQFLIVDFTSNLYFRAQRTGGTAHMEVECTDEAQYEKYLEIFGGLETYEKRAVLVEFGDTMIAASLCGYPHGEDTIADNKMEGHLCLYFYGSTAHGTQIADVEHAANILSTQEPETE